MSVIISGTNVSGLGAAVTTVAKQYEHLVKEFPDVQGVHQWGTLNIRLDYPLRIVNPDFTSSPIEWTPGFKERFSLTKIQLQLYPPVAEPQPAWVYVAHESPHRGDTLFIEILTATLQIKDADRVLIYLPSYRYSSCILL
jgi:CTP-dependent riboflavin kinase